MHNHPIGTWSDDTSLTLALIDSIAHKQAIDYHDIMDKFSEWFLYGTRQQEKYSTWVAQQAEQL